MTARKPKKKLQKRTSMWLGDDILRASAKKAARLGISRSMYFQQLLRKDLGLDGIDIQEAAPSVFG